jgi:hypothetical protein
MSACETCTSTAGEQFGNFVVCGPCQRKHWADVPIENRLSDRDAYARREVQRGELEHEDWFDREILALGTDQRSGRIDGIGDDDPADHSSDHNVISDFLGSGGWHIEYVAPGGGQEGLLVSNIDPEENELGWERAEAFITKWARNERERAFLEALAAGHDQGEARRLSGLNKPDHLLARIRNGLYDGQQAA